jgi:hypothetical protein
MVTKSREEDLGSGPGDSCTLNSKSLEAAICRRAGGFSGAYLRNKTKVANFIRHSELLDPTMDS